MADVAEVTNEAITRDHVLKRLDDWDDRLNGLYRLVETWLPKGWSVVRKTEVHIDEEMMRRFGVAPRRVPGLELKSDDERGASMEPRALWVIGVNGRVDLYSGSKHHIIVDRSTVFESPDWRISDFSDRSKLEKLDQRTLAIALSK